MWILWGIVFHKNILLWHVFQVNPCVNKHDGFETKASLSRTLTILNVLSEITLYKYFALTLNRGKAQSGHTLQATSELNDPRLITLYAKSPNHTIDYDTTVTRSLQQYVYSTN